MSAVEYFIQDNKNVLDDYILVRDNIGELLCYFCVDNVKLPQVNFDSFKRAGGRMPYTPVYLKTEDFYIFKEELLNVQ